MEIAPKSPTFHACKPLAGIMIRTDLEKIITTIILLLSFHGLNAKSEITDFDIAYSVDRKGVFLYDIETKSTECIYSTEEVIWKVFFLNDTTLIVGHQGKARIERNLGKRYFRLTETYMSINLISKEKFKYKTIDIEHVDLKTLNTRTIFYNSLGEQINQIDTSFACTGTATSNKGISFCNDYTYFHLSYDLNNNVVYSKNGSLFYINEKDTTEILKTAEPFNTYNPKGYFSPTISPNGKNVAYKYFNRNFKDSSGIYTIDLYSREIIRLASADFSNPLYSFNGQYLLIAKRLKSSKKKTWKRKIYLLDIQNNDLIKIGKGYTYLWIPK